MILSFYWYTFDVNRNTKMIPCLCVLPIGIQQSTFAQRVFEQSSFTLKLFPKLWNVSVPPNPWTCCSWSLLLFLYGTWALLRRRRRRGGSSLLRAWVRHTRPLLSNVLWETLPVSRSKSALIWDNFLNQLNLLNAPSCRMNNCLACLRSGDEYYFPFKHFWCG